MIVSARRSRSASDSTFDGLGSPSAGELVLHLHRHRAGGGQQRALLQVEVGARRRVGVDEQGVGGDELLRRARAAGSGEEAADGTGQEPHGEVDPAASDDGEVLEEGHGSRAGGGCPQQGPILRQSPILHPGTHAPTSVVERQVGVHHVGQRPRQPRVAARRRPSVPQRRGRATSSARPAPEGGRRRPGGPPGRRSGRPAPAPGRRPWPPPADPAPAPRSPRAAGPRSRWPPPGGRRPRWRRGRPGVGASKVTTSARPSSRASDRCRSRSGPSPTATSRTRCAGVARDAAPPAGGSGSSSRPGGWPRRPRSRPSGRRAGGRRAATAAGSMASGSTPCGIDAGAGGRPLVGSEAATTAETASGRARRAAR